ncbi:MAG: hypothetical protein U5K37_11710 [Natrialbaceae archaeon]|nr:hypothetical protein [Natrialbaceae archaeon]
MEVVIRDDQCLQLVPILREEGAEIVLSAVFFVDPHLVGGEVLRQGIEPLVEQVVTVGGDHDVVDIVIPEKPVQYFE